METFHAVDALIGSHAYLPPPTVRGALRRAAGLTQKDVAKTLGVKRLAVVRWEAGETLPRNPHRQHYAHLLQRLAALYPLAAVVTDTAGENDSEEDVLMRSP